MVPENGEEEDEDVREAKASIKSYLDSVKETAKFLKSIQQDEENLERQRQQLYLFNNLMLSTKLGGISNRASSEIRSAPIRSGYSLHNELDIVAPTKVGPDEIEARIPSSSLCFEPTYAVSDLMSGSYAPAGASSSIATRPRQLHTFGGSTSDSIYQQTGYSSTTTDPLEPVQPLVVSKEFIGKGGSSSFMPREGRSRSQLSDQFEDYKARRRPRPLSANIQDLTDATNVYFPSRAKRSLSQIRYSGANQGSLLAGARYATSDGQQTMMSEYMSAYGRSPAVEAPRRQFAIGVPSDDRNCLNDSNDKLNNVGGEDSDDSDLGMSAYRASAYVPKVVPQGMPARGRGFKRTGYEPAEAGGSRSIGRDLSSRNSDTGKPYERRTSLQSHTRLSLQSLGPPASSTDANDLDEGDEASQVSPRRRSMTDAGSSAAEAAGQSRLSQLEQRIQANKRRREDLLAGKVSPQPEQGANRLADGLNTRVSSRDTSSQPRGAVGVKPGGSKLTRPSKLESMEVRIKRKSYCLRLGDCSPERGQIGRGLSLEKWRSQVSSAANSPQPSMSPRGSFLSSSLKYDLLQGDLKRKLGGESSLEEKSTNNNRWASGERDPLQEAAESNSRLGGKELETKDG